MDKETVIDKIKKLLALSSSPNEHESALALERAMKLAAKANIDIRTIKSEDEPLVGRGGHCLHATKLAPWELKLYAEVAGIFGSKTLLSDWNSDQYLSVVGDSQSIEIAEYIAGYLHTTLIALLDKHNANVTAILKVLKHDPQLIEETLAKYGKKYTSMKDKQEWLYGATLRVIKLAEEQFKLEATADESAGFALMVDNRAAVSKWLGANGFTKETKVKVSLKNNAAVASGFNEAAGVTIRKAINA